MGWRAAIFEFYSPLVNNRSITDSNPRRDISPGWIGEAKGSVSQYLKGYSVRDTAKPVGITWHSSHKWISSGIRDRHQWVYIPCHVRKANITHRLPQDS